MTEGRAYSFIIEEDSQNKWGERAYLAGGLLVNEFRKAQPKSGIMAGKSLRFALKWLSGP